MKVFLGGTCNGSLWREDLIPQLSIDYFNPVIEEWSEEAYHAEVAAKLDCNYFFYCLTPKYTGYFSFAEVVNESFHYSNQTVFCFLLEYEGEKFTEAEITSLQTLGDKVVENGGLWLDNLDEVAAFLNSNQENRTQHYKYDFFISYGRKHSRSLASNLNNSFIEEGKPVWMDTFCIPTGVDFRESIKDGITRSDNFIYIISPHSVKSEYCTKELEIALKYGKRIIPILHIMEPGLEELMHPEIKKLNWIYIDAERKFQHGLSELLTITSNDREHIENNTKWLQKAITWDSHGRHKDFLLSVTETIIAEHWYNEAIEKEKSPPPSALNGIYIKESAKAVLLSRKRKKGFAFLVAALGVVMTIAFIVAINFYSQAEEERAIAEKRLAQLAVKDALLSKAEADRDRAIAARMQAEAEREGDIEARKRAEASLKRAEEQINHILHQLEEAKISNMIANKKNAARDFINSD